MGASLGLELSSIHRSSRSASRLRSVARALEGQPPVPRGKAAEGAARHVPRSPSSFTPAFSTRVVWGAAPRGAWDRWANRWRNAKEAAGKAAGARCGARRPGSQTALGTRLHRLAVARRARVVLGLRWRGGDG